MAARDAPGPAFYATGEQSTWRDLRAVLHPPYTAWHLSYVVLGAMVAPRVNWTTLVATLLAFLLAVGVCAHALDELRGRPLGTRIPSRTLWWAAWLSLIGAVALGVAGLERVGAGLVPFIVVGALLVLGYNLELFGGRLHTDLVFALAWGAFPVLTSAYAQSSSLSPSAVVLALAATLTSSAQRTLSTPVRLWRRHATSVEGTVTLDDGRSVPINRALLLAPSVRALRASSCAMMALAVAFVLARRGR